MAPGLSHAGSRAAATVQQPVDHGYLPRKKPVMFSRVVLGTIAQPLDDQPAIYVYCGTIDFTSQSAGQVDPRHAAGIANGANPSRPHPVRLRSLLAARVSPIRTTRMATSSAPCIACQPYSNVAATHINCIAI